MNVESNGATGVPDQESPGRAANNPDDPDYGVVYLHYGKVGNTPFATSGAERQFTPKHEF